VKAIGWGFSAQEMAEDVAIIKVNLDDARTFPYAAEHDRGCGAIGAADLTLRMASRVYPQ
jgi:hypothetical protein